MKSKKTLIISIASILLLSVVAVTFAYFASGVNNENPSRVSVQAGNMEMTLTNGSGNITQVLQPGNAPIEYTFTIVNNGNYDVYAKISWLDLINTYTAGSLVYKLYSSETANTFTSTPIATGNVPVSASASKVTLADSLEVKSNSTSNKVTYYKLTIELVDLPDVLQVIDANTQFYTRFTLDVGAPPLVQIVSGSSIDTVGTEIALGSGENQQNFYVISSTSDTVTALAKYNLVRTSSTSISADALQATSATDYNTVRFDDNSTTYAGSEMETYMNNYATKLNTIYSIPSNALITARAITVEELRNFGCPQSGSGTCSFGANTWLSGRYWSGSAINSGYVWRVYDSSLYDVSFNNGGNYGARAVITISKSLF